VHAGDALVSGDVDLSAKFRGKVKDKLLEKKVQVILDEKMVVEDWNAFEHAQTKTLRTNKGTEIVSDYQCNVAALEPSCLHGLTHSQSFA
jgi:hypothetical protein